MKTLSEKKAVPFYYSVWVGTEYMLQNFEFYDTETVEDFQKAVSNIDPNARIKVTQIPKPKETK